MTRECLRTGDKAGVLFRFIKNPEYLRVGQNMVFREGQTKAIGKIVRLIADAGPNVINKPKTKKMVRQTRTSEGEGESTQSNNEKKKPRHRGGRGYRNYYTDIVAEST